VSATHTRRLNRPSFSDYDGILKFVFGLTISRQLRDGIVFEEISPDFDWNGDREAPGCLWPWDERGWSDRMIPYLPKNLHLLVPADPDLQEWPYIFIQWVFGRNMGLESDEGRWLLPLLMTEIEETIASYEPDEFDEEFSIDAGRRWKVILVLEIKMILLRFMFYFTPRANMLSALDEVEDWSNYFSDVVGLIDEHGNLDHEAAALNALCRKWRIEE
jgi:hypothetical protein